MVDLVELMLLSLQRLLKRQKEILTSWQPKYILGISLEKCPLLSSSHKNIENIEKSSTTSSTTTITETTETIETIAATTTMETTHTPPSEGQILISTAKMSVETFRPLFPQKLDIIKKYYVNDEEEKVNLKCTKICDRIDDQQYQVVYLSKSPYNEETVKAMWKTQRHLVDMSKFKITFSCYKVGQLVLRI